MKTQRQKEILKLINRYSIETQEELSRRLKEMGYNATQATLSRDIKELGIGKIPTKDGKSKYVDKKTSNQDGRFIQALKISIISVTEAENLLIIKTEPGMSMAAATALDELGMPEILGCIAGDDTIFAAVKSSMAAKNVSMQIKELIGLI